LEAAKKQSQFQGQHYPQRGRTKVGNSIIKKENMENGRSFIITHPFRLLSIEHHFIGWMLKKNLDAKVINMLNVV